MGTKSFIVNEVKNQSPKPLICNMQTSNGWQMSNHHITIQSRIKLLPCKMYNKIFTTQLIVAVNDIYSMSRTRSRVISPSLVFQKQLLCSVIISTINLKRTNVLPLRKFGYMPLCRGCRKHESMCEQEGGGMGHSSWLFTVPALLTVI